MSPEPYYRDDTITLWHGDATKVLAGMPDGSVDCCVTSPPYFGLRDYGVDGQYGLEASPAEYVETMRGVFADVRRVLADDGTFWLNLGDSYVGAPLPGGRSLTLEGGTGHQVAQQVKPKTGASPKNLLGIPWRVAFALQDDGWILRNAVIWHKLTAMPARVTDRLSCRYEHVFMFSKSRRYWFDLDPIREPLYGRPQRIRAEQLAQEHGLTQDHLDAIRSVGMTDTGKARTTQTGAGKNRPEVQVLADEAKAALGGYYREFLTPKKGKNPGDVWSLSMQPFPGAHFATMPPELARRCMLSGCKPRGTVLDPFSGSGTTGSVATKLGRRYVGIDLNAEYLDLSLRTRLAQSALVDGEAS